MESPYTTFLFNNNTFDNNTLDSFRDNNGPEFKYPSMPRIGVHNIK